MIRRTRVEVDLSAIVENAGALTALTGTNVYAVVKADGYGHGAVAVARALAATSAVAGFAVSLVEEAVVLRDAGIAFGPLSRRHRHSDAAGLRLSIETRLDRFFVMLRTAAKHRI